MTLYLDRSKRRIVCRWDEPTEYIMNKQPVVINRSRRTWARVTRRGKVSKTDLARRKGHPMLPWILLFSEALQAGKDLPDETARPCEVCGSRHQTSLCFDTEGGRAAWLCPDHRPWRPGATSRLT